MFDGNSPAPGTNQANQTRATPLCPEILGPRLPLGTYPPCATARPVRGTAP